MESTAVAVNDCLRLLFWPMFALQFWSGPEQQIWRFSSVSYGNCF